MFQLPSIFPSPSADDGYSDSAILNLTILGNGYFVVRNPETNVSFATQYGRFTVDDSGCIVSETGMRLQGRMDGPLSPIGDLQIPAAGLPIGTVPDATMLCYMIDEHGKIMVQMGDGISLPSGQILLQNFQDPEALVRLPHCLYSNLDAAAPLPCCAEPGTNGLGLLEANVLELSHWETEQ